MSLSKSEDHLFNSILKNKNISKKKWESDTLEKRKADFLIGFTNPKSQIKKDWNEKELIQAKRDLIADFALNKINNERSDNNG